MGRDNTLWEGHDIMGRDTISWGGTLHYGDGHNIKEREATLWVGSLYDGE